MSDPDDLHGLAAWLRGSYGRVHEHHGALDSTNDRALALLREGAPHGAVVTADAQHAGRGRRGRQWFSPAAESLYVSLVLRPGPVHPPERLGALGLAAGVGLREGLHAALPRLREPVRLKWPNDLHVGGRKLGGILCEARWLSDAPEIVVGFGLNVHTRVFPAELESLATSVAQANDGDALGRAVLLGALLEGLESALEPFLRGGFAAVRERYLPHCETLGRVVQVGDAAAPAGAQRGTALRLDDDGALWVRPERGGEAYRVESSDVWLVPTGES